MAYTRTMVVALGGNAVDRADQAGTIEELRENCWRSAEQLARLAMVTPRMAIVHGNGPEVGKLLLRSEAARHTIPPSPLDVCGAASQGSLGYLIELALRNAFRDLGAGREVCSLLTQVVVDPNDPAFQMPTKPVGKFYSREEAQALASRHGWRMSEDAGRGYRRVVPSPYPIGFVGVRVIERLVHDGVIAICCGGGGIPVSLGTGGILAGVEAVIDKDLAAAQLALALNADTLLILTAVEKVYLRFKSPDRVSLENISTAEAIEYYRGGQFPPGSMGPKIRAAIDFLKGGGEQVIITEPDRAVDALEGRAGTRIYGETRWALPWSA